MATDPKRRQKALAKKTAKRKAKAALARIAPPAGSLAGLRPAALPIYECLVPAGLFEKGIGNLLVSRKLPDGNLVVGGFLVDAWCLGVKNALLQVWSEAKWERQVDRLGVREEPEEVEPAYAKKLILDAVAYARDLGFAPHPDYRAAARILEGIDETQCSEVFAFGQAERPHFFAGPNDTLARCRQILDTLRARLGPDGFHYTVSVQDPSQFRALGFGDEEHDDAP